MNRNLILSRLLANSCLLTIVACQGELAVVDDTVGNDDANLTGEDGETNASLPAPGGTAEPIDTDCPCAQDATLQALSCGRGVPYIQNDIIQATADGSIVAFNLCDEPTPDCVVAYWQATSGTWRLGKGFLVGLDAVGDTLAVQTGGFETTLLDISGQSQVFEINIVPGRGALSRDGRSLVGQATDDFVHTFLARAERGGGVERLESMGQGSIYSLFATPDAGTAVGGFSTGPEDATFRWTESELTFGLGELPPGATFAIPQAISDDGKIIAGTLAAIATSFRWSEESGFIDLGPALGTILLSADGSTQIGATGDPLDSARSVYRWQEATGAVSLVSGTSASAIGVSADGGVVAGRLEDAGTTRTFIWDAEHGTRRLEPTLELAGVDLSGWTLGEPRVLSANGKVLIGDALCNGAPAVYRVELPE
jgi:uncharacterized membrane protein